MPNVIKAVASPGETLVSFAKPLAVCVLIALCCWLSIAYTRAPNGFSTLWIASGVLAGILLTAPAQRWPAYVVAGFVGNAGLRLLVGDPWVTVTLLAFASTLESVLVAMAVVRFAGNLAEPAQLPHTSRIATASAVGAAAISAAIAALLHPASGLWNFLNAYATWFGSHAVGMVIFATFTVVVRVTGVRLIGKQTDRVAFGLTMLFIAAVCVAVFQQTRYPLLFLVYPPLLLGAFRYRFAGLVIGMGILLCVSIVATLAGQGPFQLIPDSSPTERLLLLQFFIASSCLLIWPVAIVLTERRFLASTLRESERRYRVLAEYSRDLVMRIAPDGSKHYVSPSARAMLGWDPDQISGVRLDLIHPDDVTVLTQAIRTLFTHGGSTTIAYRARHADGHNVWIEANMQWVPGEDSGEPEIVYSGRDISRRMEVRRELLENQRRLRAITDNLPAFVLHVDTNERYTFANEPTSRIMGFPPDEIIGKTVREFVGDTNYAEIKPRVDAALRGETVTFEIERVIGGAQHFYQSSYVPEIDSDGVVHGFYVMSSDITQIKHNEHALLLLARFDGLTTLANRFHFNESADLALARQRRSGRSLALLYLDIDHFKEINDTHGHAVGDAVLKEFSRRLKGSLRITDLAARLGGDEFVVLVEDAESREVPELIANKMMTALRAPIVIEGLPLQVTSSIGIAFCRKALDSRDKLLHVADTALYEAKAAGRNTVRMAVVDVNPG